MKKTKTYHNSSNEIAIRFQSQFNIYIRHALLNIERAMSKLDTEVEGGCYEELQKLYDQLDEFAEYEVPLKEIIA